MCHLLHTFYNNKKNIKNYIVKMFFINLVVGILPFCVNNSIIFFFFFKYLFLNVDFLNVI